ncbi:MAG: trehalose-phosphatase [Nitrospira sp.]|nr:trehalose-phosphatase [Nitrospira sp.]MCP9463014.1 trehalose-phosphatase [Nitrospira sp.]MCP9474609.1 trehalose-phosphatase [Nitrospira sp.]
MTYLLSDEGRDALRKMINRSVLYAFDFDGTLAKISSERGSVKLSPTMHEWLRELARRVPCAVVSGRALDDLTPRVNGAVPHLIGNHGAESPLTPAAVLNDMDLICSGWVKQLQETKARFFAGARVVIENKRYSLTLHYRGVDDPDALERELVHTAEQLTPSPRIIPGKASVNLLPPGSPGKGEASFALMNHLHCTGLFFIGDDETDETVFAMQEGLTLGVRVGYHPHSQARYYVKHQSEVEDVLRFLVHRLDGTPETARSTH